MGNGNGAGLAKVEPKADFAMMERVLLGGDLSRLSAEERTSYYLKVCESVGLNPLTKPFEYLRLNGKEVLYATRNCTDQLRKVHNISVTIVGREKMGDIYVVTARARTPDGREDESTGAVTLGSAKGDNLANALMKCETKAKRRVTLSICGLSMLDETELETVQGARPVTATSPVREIVGENDPDMRERMRVAAEKEANAEAEWAPVVDGWLRDLEALIERVTGEDLDGADELSAWCNANGGEMRKLPRKLASKLWAKLGGNKSSVRARLGVSGDDLKRWLREAPDAPDPDDPWGLHNAISSDAESSSTVDGELVFDD